MKNYFSMPICLDGLVKRTGKWSKLAVLISMLMQLVQGSLDLYNDMQYYENNNEVYNYEHSYKDVKECEIEPGEIKTDKYTAVNIFARFIKNLSSNMEYPQNITDVIIEEINCLDIKYSDSILTCFYTEIEETNGKRKQYVPRPNKSSRPEKSILIPLCTLKNKKVHDRRVEEALRIKRRPEINEKIENIMHILYRVINRYICIKYIKIVEQTNSIKNANFFFISNQVILEWVDEYEFKISKTESFIYNLYKKILDQDEKYKLYEAFLKTMIDFPLVKEILDKEKDPIVKYDQLKSISQLEEDFTQEKKQIADQIKDVEDMCVSYSREEEDSSERRSMFLEEARERVIMYINILSREAIVPCYINGNVFSGYIIDIVQIKEQTNAWNRGLAYIMADAIEKYKQFSGGKQELIEMVRSENKKIFCELERKSRREEIAGYFYMNRIDAAIKEIDKKVRLGMDAQYTCSKKYSNRNMPKEVINQENAEVFDLLLDILIGVNVSMRPFEKKEVAEKIKKKAYPLLIEIPKYYIEYDYFKELEIKIEKEKQKIVDILFGAFFDKELVGNRYEDLIIIKKALKVTVEKIVGFMFYKHAVWIDYSRSRNIQKIIQMEEKFVSANATVSMIDYLVYFANKFWYNISPYEVYLIDRMNSIDRNDDVSEWLLKFENSNIVFGILKYIFQAYQYINNLCTYTEIWNNSAILHVKNSFHFENQTIANITYKTNQGGIYVKIIDFTDANIEAFRNAKTFLDIEEINGYTIVSTVNSIRNIYESFI